MEVRIQQPHHIVDPPPPLSVRTCADLTCNRLNPSGEVVELSGLVTKILQVFEKVATLSLKEKWTMIALQVRPTCTYYTIIILYV